MWCLGVRCHFIRSKIIINLVNLWEITMDSKLWITTSTENFRVKNEISSGCTNINWNEKVSFELFDVRCSIKSWMEINPLIHHASKLWASKITKLKWDIHTYFVTFEKQYFVIKSWCWKIFQESSIDIWRYFGVTYNLFLAKKHFQF